MTDSNTITPTGKFIARIDEDRCIGCTLCIKACPFDAIVGAPKLMHTIITHYCTGCKLCLPPCPVDCIELEKNYYFEKACRTISLDEQRELKIRFAKFSRQNKQQRTQRLERLKKEQQELFERRKSELLQKL